MLGGAALVVAALAVWRYWDSPAVQGLLRPEALRQRIEFDNGSVRLPRFDAAPAAGDSVPGHPPVRVRKCLKGKQILYTEFDCPAGTREQAIDAGSVTFVAPQDLGKALPKEGAKAPAMRAKPAPGEGSDRP